MSPDSAKQTTTEVYRAMKREIPGFTAFYYNSMNTHLLQLIVERISGKTLNEFYSDRVWRHIGAQADAYIAVTHDEGKPMSWAFMNSTLRDFGRWGMLFTPSASTITKETIIPERVIKRFQEGGHRDIFLKGVVGKEMQASFPDIKGLSNHYQWDVIFPDGDFMKLGNGGQGLYISPGHDTVVVWFSTGDHQEEAMARAIVESLPK